MDAIADKSFKLSVSFSRLRKLEQELFKIVVDNQSRPAYDWQRDLWILILRLLAKLVHEGKVVRTGNPRTGKESSFLVPSNTKYWKKETKQLMESSIVKKV